MVRNVCAIILLGGFASCRQVAPTGGSSFTVADDLGGPPQPPVDASKLKLAESIGLLVPPKPIPPLPLPAYPRAALAAHLGDIRVAVRVSVDSAGNVVDVSPSLTWIPYTHAFGGEFLDAVRQAVLQWRFEPGQLVHLSPQPGGRPLLDRSEPVDSTLTLEFTFFRSGKVQFPW